MRAIILDRKEFVWRDFAVKLHYRPLGTERQNVEIDSVHRRSALFRHSILKEKPQKGDLLSAQGQGSIPQWCKRAHNRFLLPDSVSNALYQGMCQT